MPSNDSDLSGSHLPKSSSYTMLSPNTSRKWVAWRPFMIGTLVLYSIVMTYLFAWAFSGREINSAATKSAQLLSDEISSSATQLEQTISANLSSYSVWPLPNVMQVQPGTGSVPVTGPFAVYLADPATSSATLKSALNRQLKYVFPCTNMDDIRISPATAIPAGTAPGTVIRIQLSSTNETLSVNTNERYTINITGANSAVDIYIHAATVYGAIRALDTLSQLVQHTITPTCSYSLISVPVNIDDWPRMQHRGLLIDTSRHFYPIESLERLVDGMSSAKMNVLHWHISDAQSFPMKFNDLPELADSGAYSPSQIYNEPDVVQFIEYCRIRGVRVIPEFDIPGHVYSFSHAFPALVLCPNMQPFPAYGNSPPTGQLDPTNPETYVLLNRLLTAINRVFPDQYAHLGHDEMNQNCWAQFDNGNTSVTLSKFHAQLRPILQQVNPRKNWIVWEEPFTALNLETTPTPRDQSVFQTVQLWLDAGPMARVQQANKQVIISDYKYWYLDCGEGGWTTGARAADNGWCTHTSWVNVYSFDPFNVTADRPPPDMALDSINIEANAALGGEVAMWSEQTDQFNLFDKVFPRTYAFAERVWSSSAALKGLTWTSIMNRVHLSRVQLLLPRNVASAPVQPQWCIGREVQCSMTGNVTV